MDYQLHLGDCLEVMAGMEAGSVDAVITDPPYNVGIDYGETTDDNKEHYADWCKAWFDECRRISAGPIAISVGQANIATWAQIAPPDWWIAWWKPAAMGRCIVGFNNWEPIALYGRPAAAACDVIRATIKPDDSADFHPCPKPIDWAAKQIEMLSTPGSTIFDPFAGSGTTAIAAIQTDRRFIGCEINPHFRAMAIARIQSNTMQPRLINLLAMQPHLFEVAP